MIPRSMQGGWVRSGIAVDGAPPAEDALVWWLQAPSKHCDLRLPYAGPSGSGGREGLMSFAGTTSWVEPRLIWTPELELDTSIFEDIGVITWDGPDMIETGAFASERRDVEYVERWQKLPGSDGALLALSRPGGRIVRTGSYAMTILDARPAGDFTAVAWTLEGDGWSLHHCWPPGATAPTPPLDVQDGASTVLLSDDLLWTIDERRTVADKHG